MERNKFSSVPVILICARRNARRIIVDAAFLAALFGGIYAVGWGMGALLRAAGV